MLNLIYKRPNMNNSNFTPLQQNDQITDLKELKS